MMLIGLMMWVSSQKAAEISAMRTKHLPIERTARNLIESERDIERLRGMARIQSIGASGSMEALLHVTEKSAATLLPVTLVPLASILVGAFALRRSKAKPGEPGVIPAPSCSEGVGAAGCL